MNQQYLMFKSDQYLIDSIEFNFQKDMDFG